MSDTPITDQTLRALRLLSKCRRDGVVRVTNDVRLVRRDLAPLHALTMPGDCFVMESGVARGVSNKWELAAILANLAK